MNQPSVSVLIPVLDEEHHLRDCVARMLAQDCTGPVEFLFVDGGSADASRSILEDLAARDDRIRVLDNPQRRTPFALNIGLRASESDFIARMDAHTRYPPAYLRLGVERMQRGDAVHVSGPAIAAGDGHGWTDRVALALRTPLGVGGAAFRTGGDAPAEFEVDTGFAGLWRREVLVRAGGWDEAWPTDQDCELAFRLKTVAPGPHVCLPAMSAEYIPRASLERLGRQYWQFGLHKIKTFRRHPGAMRPSHALPPAVTAAAVAAVLAPRPVRTLARAGMTLYVAALGATAAQSLRAGAAPGDAVALPAIFATMHLAYGAGLFAGVRRYGLPAAAIAGAAGRVVAR